MYKNLFFLSSIFLAPALLASLHEPTLTRASTEENWKVISRGSFGTGAIGVTITNPGNYMLSESITAVAGNTAALIQINTDDVVLDLGGHSLNGTAAAGKGIFINGKKNITLKNGHLNGVQAVNIHVAAGSINVRIEAMTITNPGSATDIQLDASNVKINNLTIVGNGSTGNCIAMANSMNDITLDDIRMSNTTGKGIVIGNSCYNIRLKNLEIDTCLGTSNGILFGTNCYDTLLDTFRLSNITSDGINIGNSSYGIVIKNGTLTNCTGNGFLIGSDTHGVHLSNIKVTGCANGIQAAGMIGSIIEKCTVTKSNGASAYACKLINSQNVLISQSNFFESISAGNPVYGLWLVTCKNITCTDTQSGGHSGAQAFGFKLDTNCFGCNFENCMSQSNTATSVTAGQGAFGFSLATAKGCSLKNCTSTSHQGALQAYGFYLTNSTGTTLANCKALQNFIATGSATALCAGFYSLTGSANKFQRCEGNGQNAGNVTSTPGYGAFGFYLTNEQQTSLYQCAALGNGAVTAHAATAAGFYFDGTVNPACKFLEIRECAANSNCTSGTSGITAYGFWDSAAATTNIFLDCFAASNSDNATLRIVTNYWANLPIGGTVAANFPKVEATIDGLLDIANKPLFYNISITS